MRWHTNPKKCSHSNEDICKTCDHDRYYRSRPEAFTSDTAPVLPAAAATEGDTP